METNEEKVLTEIHWVVFPAEEFFAAYQKDEELAGLQSERMSAAWKRRFGGVGIARFPARFKRSWVSNCFIDF